MEQRAWVRACILWSRAERQRLLCGVVLCGDGVFRRAMWGDWKPVYGPASEAFPEEAGSEQIILR